VALLSPAEVDRALAEKLPDWERDGDAITRQVRVPTFLAAVGLVQRVAEVAEVMDHHPDIDIRYTTLTFTLSTHSAGGVTAKDLDLAGQIDRLVADAFGD
jgi:4a-hydroxytetrahydrobiopterin dehydratase